MRILIVSQYFWPEYFRINDLAQALSKNDEIEVLTGYPNYPKGIIYEDFKKNKKKYDQFEKIKIYRVPVYARKTGSKLHLVINYFSYLLSAIVFGSFLLKKKKYDIIITFASSPVTVALVGIYFSKLKNCSSIIWLLDLWPNVLHDLRIINNNSVLYKFFKILVGYIYKNIDLILCQSLSFKKIINKQFNNKYKDKLIFFPSWPEKINSNLKNYKYNLDKNYINIFFAGNIGDSQNFNLIIDLFKRLQIKKFKIRLYVAGEGRGLLNLKNKIFNLNLKNIFLLGWKDFNEIQNYFYSADFLLISLKYLETFDSTIPGKFQTYLQYKKPILGFIGGETNMMINKYKIGKAFDYFDDENFIEEVSNSLQKKIVINYNNFDKLLNIFSIDRQIRKINFYVKKLFNLDNTIIKIITSGSTINYEKNFILSAFNLAFLGFLSKGEICLTKNLYLWPDGYFSKRFLPSNIIKIPGRFLLKNLRLDTNVIKSLVILGNLSNNSKIYLENLLKIKVIHVPLPYGELNDFKDYIPIFEKNQMCIITLPTPKQEILANHISQVQNFYKIFCLGAAVSMSSGDEKTLPNKYANIIFAEALWRLQYEPKRRILRIIETLAYYFIGVLRGKYKKIKFEVLNEKF
jgi:colanic acid biosynthesis glycosyl transferase WcaI